MTETRKIVKFGAFEFYIEVVNENYTKLVPVSDPDWCLKWMNVEKDKK